MERLSSLVLRAPHAALASARGVEAMGQRFEAITNPQGLAWGGVELRQEEWLGDKVEQPTGKSQDAKATKQATKASNADQQLVFEG